MLYIYFNESYQEIFRNYIKKDENVSKIRILIDMEVKSISELFQYCKIKKVIFIKFNRTDFIDMSFMFECCESLKELDIMKVKTDNVINMGGTFWNCLSLKELDLSNFKTGKVKNMSWMFRDCSKLEK